MKIAIFKLYTLFKGDLMIDKKLGLNCLLQCENELCKFLSSFAAMRVSMGLFSLVKVFFSM